MSKRTDFAPFEGFIADIGPRKVTVGQALLLALNTDELDLELLRIDSDQTAGAAPGAEGRFDRAQERQLRAEIEVKRIERRPSNAALSGQSSERPTQR